MARKSHYKEHRTEVIQLIADTALHHARPPSIRTLADAVGVGVATMHSYLNQLKEEGVVEWHPRQHRSLHLTPQGFQQLSPSTTP